MGFRWVFTLWLLIGGEKVLNWALVGPHESGTKVWRIWALIGVHQRMTLDIDSVSAMSDEPEPISNITGCVLTDRRSCWKTDIIQSLQYIGS